MRLKLTNIPDEVIEHYNLRELATADGYVYCDVSKGMYGLPQAGIIAQELLAARLGEHAYYQSKIVNGLWKHKTRQNDGHQRFLFEYANETTGVHAS